MSNGIALALLLAVVVLTRPASSRAQSQDGTPAQTAGETAQYRRLIEQAIEENNAQNFVEARALFREAHALWPNARTLRGLGMMEFELRNYVDSVELLQQALSSSVRRLEGKMRQETDSLLARARAYVARVQLEIKPSAPPGTQINLDGAPLGDRLADALLLSIGDHSLRVRAPGYEETIRSFSIKDAKDQRLLIELGGPRIAHTAPTLSTQALPEEKKDSRLVRNPWLWTGVGAIVVGAVVTGVLLGNRGRSDAEKPIAGDIGGVVEALSGR